jgi:ATP-dependent RNA helicase DeaD
LVSAQTGSGKTVAFGLAIAPTLLQGEDRLPYASAPLALCIAPTRELAMQVKGELEWLYRETGAQIASCVGGMDARAERKALQRGAHIVVGTPGRLRDHIERNALDLSEIRATVLDEADEMLDLGFRDPWRSADRPPQPDVLSHRAARHCEPCEEISARRGTGTGNLRKIPAR